MGQVISSKITSLYGSRIIGASSNKLKLIWKEFNNYSPNCSCDNYSYGGIKHLIDHYQNDYFMPFLMGLYDLLFELEGNCY